MANAQFLNQISDLWIKSEAFPGDPAKVTAISNTKPDFNAGITLTLRQQSGHVAKVVHAVQEIQFSISVRGVHSAVTESTLTKIFGDMGNKVHSLKIAAPPPHKRFATKAAYLNFSEGDKDAILKMDGTSPEWNEGTAITVREQDVAVARAAAAKPITSQVAPKEHPTPRQQPASDKKFVSKKRAKDLAVEDDDGDEEPAEPQPEPKRVKVITNQGNAAAGMRKVSASDPSTPQPNGGPVIKKHLATVAPGGGLISASKRKQMQAEEEARQAAQEAINKRQKVDAKAGESANGGNKGSVASRIGLPGKGGGLASKALASALGGTGKGFTSKARQNQAIKEETESRPLRLETGRAAKPESKPSEVSVVSKKIKLGGAGESGGSSGTEASRLKPAPDSGSRLKPPPDSGSRLKPPPGDGGNAGQRVLKLGGLAVKTSEEKVPTPKASKTSTPKAATPKAATPKAATPKAATPKGDSVEDLEAEALLEDAEGGEEEDEDEEVTLEDLENFAASLD